MEKNYMPDIDMWALGCDQDHILHRTGSGDYPEIRHTCVRNPGEWEEVAVSDIPPYTEEEYKAMVSELIHERYSIDDEIALAANASSPMILADGDRASAFADEYAAYQTYRAECKVRAKEMLLAKGKDPASGGMRQ